MADDEPNSNKKDERKRKRRWGDATTTNNGSGGGAEGVGGTTNNVGTTSATTTTTTTTSNMPMMDSKAKALALQESVRARLAALKAAKMKNTTTMTTTASTTTTAAATAAAAAGGNDQRPVKRAKHYELDMSVTGPTYQSTTSSTTAAVADGTSHKQNNNKKQQSVPKNINPYLAHRQSVVVDDGNDNQKSTGSQKDGLDATKGNHDRGSGLVKASNNNDNDDDGRAGGAIYDSNVDARLEESVLAQSTDRRRRGRKQLSFVEPGTFVKIAERKRQKAVNAAEAGFLSGRKTGQYVQSTTIMANIYGQSHEERMVDNEKERYDVPNRLPARPEAGVAFGTYLLTPGEVDESKIGADRKANRIPEVCEWWDMELLPSKLKKQVLSYDGKVASEENQSRLKLFGSDTKSTSVEEGKEAETTPAAAAAATATSPVVELREKCSKLASLSYSKTADLIQHIVPIKPANAAVPREDLQPVLHMTKAELKRQRKLRRQEKQREMQDLQAAGLIPAPEPRLTLKNFIRVLGDQAYVDPSQMEQKVMEQVQARQKAHMERNEAKKLTKEQRKEKRAKKLQEDTSSTGIHVALFYVKDMSHPYHRAKVDLNAQQFNLTGGVVECLNPQLSCVIVEGGPKAIQKYKRLMLVRMKWAGTDEDDDDDEEEEEEEEEGMADGGTGEEGETAPRRKKHKFNKDNKCELVWTGIATKRFFKGFIFQACETSSAASKILRAKGVGHFWEQLLTHASGSGESFRLKLADDSDDDDDDDDDQDKMEIDG